MSVSDRSFKIRAIREVMKTPRPFDEENMGYKSKRRSLTGVMCHSCEGVVFVDEDQYIDDLIDAPFARPVCGDACIEIHKIQHPDKPYFLLSISKRSPKNTAY